MQVGKQLEASAENQEKLLNVQKESLTVQERSLKYGQDLKEIIETISSSIASSQQTILGIQNWLISEMSWFDTVLFYLMSLCFVFIFTSLRSSNASRLPLLILLFGGILSERFICQLFLAFNKSRSAENSHELLMSFIWIFRYTLVASCVIVIVISICSYKDYEKINNGLLVKIRWQNEKLIELFENQVKFENKTFNIDVVHENEIRKENAELEKLSENDRNKSDDNKVLEFETKNSNGVVHSPLSDRITRKQPYKSPEINNLKKYNLRDRRATPDTSFTYR